MNIKAGKQAIADAFFALGTANPHEYKGYNGRFPASRIV